MVCPLCGTRRARRGCPALNKQICPVCCGTKRLVEIDCPSACTWLASAREHPPATMVRQQQRDVDLLARSMRDLSESQGQLFFMVAAFLSRYRPVDFHAPIDDDVGEAVGSLAATFETAARGLIYDHRPASVVAERLTIALKRVLTEAGQGRGSAFERDAAVVLRRIEEAVREVRAADQNSRQAFLDLLRRMITAPEDHAEGTADQSSRLIVP